MTQSIVNCSFNCSPISPTAQVAACAAGTLPTQAASDHHHCSPHKPADKVSHCCGSTSVYKTHPHTPLCIRCRRHRKAIQNIGIETETVGEHDAVLWLPTFRHGLYLQGGAEEGTGHRRPLRGQCGSVKGAWPTKGEHTSEVWGLDKRVWGLGQTGLGSRTNFEEDYSCQLVCVCRPMYSTF